MVHHKVCPLCSSALISLDKNCTDHFISKEVFAIFRCTSCGLVFTQDCPDEAEIYKYYESENYISHSDTSKGFSNKIYHLARNIMLIRKRKLINKVTGLNKGNILDIGSGTGYFLWIMKKAGWHVKGIEISEKARNYSASAFGLEILKPEAIKSLESNLFDCITLWHVLEHFHEPLKYFSEIKRLLKPEGVCLVALPNCSSFDAEYYKEHWAAYDVPRHLWHFNPSTFKIHSEKSGLKTEKIKILPLDVFYISVLSESYKGSNLSFIKGIAQAFYFSFLSAFNKRRSSSIIYILRNNNYQ